MAVTLVVTTVSKVKMQDEKAARMLASFMTEHNNSGTGDWSVYDLDPVDTVTAEVETG